MGKRQRERKKSSRQQQQEQDSEKRRRRHEVPLSAELRADLDDVLASCPSSKRYTASIERPRAKRLSGVQKRRQAKMREKAAKLAARGHLFETLQKTAATIQELEVVKASVAAEMHSTSAKRARAALLKERSGINLDNTERESLHGKGNGAPASPPIAKRRHIDVEPSPVSTHDTPPSPRAVSLSPDKQSVLELGHRLREGTTVVARMWDGTLVRGVVSLAFGDGYCDVRTTTSSLDGVAPCDLWLDDESFRPPSLPTITLVPPPAVSVSRSDSNEPQSLQRANVDSGVSDSQKGGNANDQISHAQPLRQHIDTATPSDAPKPASSSATLMMEQLAKLKTAIAAQEQHETTHQDEALQTESSRTDESPHKVPSDSKYVPHPLVLPSTVAASQKSERLATNTLARKTKVRHVDRPAALQATRMDLPACGMEQEVMEAITASDIVVLTGETGSGKSTQLPQFLYEAGFGRVVVTQPRRVAAVTTARRVALELGAVEPRPNGPPSIVGYRTRFEDGGIDDSTAIIFETDGVLLQQMRRDILLRQYDAVVIDEAHERSLNTDVLLGLMSRAAPLRRELATRALEDEDDEPFGPLKVIIMSASPLGDVVDNERLWTRGVQPAAFVIPGRQHKVEMHFARLTRLDDYVDAAFTRTCALHEGEPLTNGRGDRNSSGGILVFLTGKHEVEMMCAKLRQRYDNRAKAKVIDSMAASARVVALYASASLAKQELAFAPVGPGRRQIVVATNVAETSVTIPGVTYVIDSGRVKRRVASTGGAIAFEIGWISKASAQQRAGRAGRVGPGEFVCLFECAAASLSNTLCVSRPVVLSCGNSGLSADKKLSIARK